MESLNEKHPIFNFYAPKDNYIGILSIPHSGEIIPPEFVPFLTSDIRALHEDVDFKVDELVDIDELNQAGIAVVKANIIRTTVDLNRSKDKALFAWRSNSKGIPLVKDDPHPELAQLMIESYRTPYYEFLRGLINELKRKYKKVSFVDLHSMPSSPTEYHLKQNPNQKMTRPDFCISDYHGKTCEPKFIHEIQTLLLKYYDEVTINDPYVGGNITQEIHTFGDINNIQIEINRGIYMDEVKKSLITDKVVKLKPALTDSLITFFQKFDRDYR